MRLYSKRESTLHSLTDPIVYRPTESWSHDDHGVVIIPSPRSGDLLARYLSSDGTANITEDYQYNLYGRGRHEMVAIPRYTWPVFHGKSESKTVSARPVPVVIKANRLIYGYTIAKFGGANWTRPRKVDSLTSTLQEYGLLCDVGDMDVSIILPVTCVRCSQSGSDPDEAFGVCSWCEGTGGLSWRMYQRLFMEFTRTAGFFR